MARVQVAEPEETIVDKYGLGKFISDVEERPGSELEQALTNMVGCERVNVAEAFFPTISPRFLELTCKKPSIEGKLEGNKFEVFLPRFSPYNYFGKGSVTLEMKGIFYSYNGENSTIEYKLEIQPNLSPALERHFKKGISWQGMGISTANRDGFYGFQLKGEFNFVQTSYFNGQIPSTIKAKIPNYKRVFGEKLFLVSEADWVEHETKLPPLGDPLLIGTLGNRVYLLDQFNCTSLERYCAKEMIVSSPKDRDRKK